MRPASELEDGSEGRPGELVMVMLVVLVVLVMVVVVVMVMVIKTSYSEQDAIMIIFLSNINSMMIKTNPAILNEIQGEKSFLRPFAES